MEICCECFYSLMVPIVSLVRIELDLSLSLGPLFYMDHIRYGTPGRGLNPRALVAGNVVLNLP